MRRIKKRYTENFQEQPRTAAICICNHSWLLTLIICFLTQQPLIGDTHIFVCLKEMESNIDSSSVALQPFFSLPDFVWIHCFFHSLRRTKPSNLSTILSHELQAFEQKINRLRVFTLLFGRNRFVAFIAF